MDEIAVWGRIRSMQNKINGLEHDIELAKAELAKQQEQIGHSRLQLIGARNVGIENGKNWVDFNDRLEKLEAALSPKGAEPIWGMEWPASPYAEKRRQQNKAENAMANFRLNSIKVEGHPKMFVCEHKPCIHGPGNPDGRACCPFYQARG